MRPSTSHAISLRARGRGRGFWTVDSLDTPGPAALQLLITQFLNPGKRGEAPTRPPHLTRILPPESNFCEPPPRTPAYPISYPAMARLPANGDAPSEDHLSELRDMEEFAALGQFLFSFGVRLLKMPDVEREVIISLCRNPGTLLIGIYRI